MKMQLTDLDWRLAF